MGKFLMAVINGVTVFENPNDVTLFLISHISTDLESLILKNISSICYGHGTLKYSNNYDHKKTIVEFLKRYNKKDPRTKKGMIGELLAHVLIINHMQHFVQGSPFFNTQERSIKKGFDIVYYDKSSQGIWLSESKSGQTKKHDSKAKTFSLINSAKSDIHSKMNNVKLTQWQTAIFDAQIAVDQDDVKQTVIDLLESAKNQLAQNNAVSKQNVILISVLFRDLADSINFSDIQQKYTDISKLNLFNKLMVVSLQKETYSKVEQFLNQASI
jgi:hypothetical protein